MNEIPIGRAKGSLSGSEHKGKTDFLHATVARYIVKDVPVVMEDDSLKDVIQSLKKSGNSLTEIDCVYVVNGKGLLSGVLLMRDIFTHPEGTVVEKVMQQKVFSASPKTDVERIAHLALRHGIGPVPIVESGRLVGVIPGKSITSIVNNSLRKDLFHFAGIHRSHLEYENSMGVPVLTSMLHRGPWLAFGILGIIAVAGFIGLFEDLLEKYLILAFFVPAIVYASGALSTQVQTIFVRDLALMGEELQPRTYFPRQMSITALLAIIISGMFFIAVTVFWGQPYVGFVISAAAAASLLLTSYFTLAITLTIKHLGYDPAMGGGPFSAVVSDATSVVVYLFTATVLLGF